MQPGSAADEAGLRPTRRAPSGAVQPGDVIVGIDGEPVRETDDLFRALDAHEVGDTITLEVRRGSRTARIPVTLQALEG